jgi:RNA polymerase sigma factor (sigma-70 family)
MATTRPVPPPLAAALGGTDPLAADGDLLARFLRHRDEAAFAALVRRHGPMVLAVCRRILVGAADAEDAFQATFLVLVRNAAALASRPTLGDWLHGVARRTALKARVMAARRRDRERAAARLGEQAGGERNDWLGWLDEEVGRLPARYRRPVVLCDLEGLSRREAARVLGWPEGTVAGYLARGRELLGRRLLRRAGVAGVTAAAAWAADPVRAVPPHLMTAASAAALGAATPAVLALARAAAGAGRAWLAGGVLTLVAGGLLAVGGAWASAPGPADGTAVPPDSPTAGRPHAELAVPTDVGLVRAAAPVQPAPPAPRPDTRATADALRQAAEALDLAEGDYLTCIRLWCDVADLRHRLGDRDGAAAAVQKARSVTLPLNPIPGPAPTRIAETLARFGEARAVLDLAATVPEASPRSRGNPRQILLEGAAREAAAAGHDKAAGEIIAALPDEAAREALRRSVRVPAVTRLLQKGDVAAALRAADELPTAVEKVYALAGRPELSRGYDDARWWDGIAAAQSRVGDRDEAKRTAAKAVSLLPDVEPKRRPIAAAAVARAFAQLDDLPQARKALAEVSAAGQKADKGGADNVKAAALFATACVGAAEARAGRDVAAADLVKHFDQPDDQAYLLHTIALAQARAGRKDVAAANFARAVAFALKDPDGGALHNIASAQALAGDFAGAARTAEQRPSGGVTWANIAHAQTQAGDFAGARRTAARARPADRGSPYWYASILRGVARQQARAGQAAAVREQAAQLDDRLVRAHVLVGLAEGLYP